MRQFDFSLAAIMIGTAMLATGVFVLPAWILSMVVTIIAKALVVISVVILMRAGLVSFGQGLYYCIGGYAVGLGGPWLNVTDMFALLGLAALAGLVSGAVLGVLMCRYREIFFAMFSLALAMILYGVLSQSQALGSTDGFNVSRPTVLGMMLATGQVRTVIYLTACLLGGGVAALIHVFFKSEMGYASQAASENEIRLQYLGASPNRVFYGNYVLASVAASLGGALLALNYGHVGPDMAYWTQSGEFIFIALVGGTGNVIAALIGAGVFEAVRTYALEWAPDAWQLILGTVLVLIVSFMPNGLWTLVRSLRPGTRRRTAIENTL
ncbi:MAG: branched-chain amino acid ABC transporter permease [Castellaniella sp.]